MFFDNLQVTHTRGPILEETHYYPFGLTMAGISTEALSFGDSKNKMKYQGQEIAAKEFSDGSGICMYEFRYRMHDPQIGRFWQVDPLTSDMPASTPYSYAANNPIKYIDLFGLSPSNSNGGDAWTTTYVDKNNRVIDVVNDGKLDIIRFDDIDVDNWNGTTKDLQGKTNGTKIGETVYWYDFMYLNESDGTLSTPMRGVKIDNPVDILNSKLNKVLKDRRNKIPGTDGNSIFGSAILLLQLLNKDYEMSACLDECLIATILGWLALDSRSGGIYDIKVSLLQANIGYLYKVENGTSIYTTGRALGNLLFGANMNTAQDHSFLSKAFIWKIAMRIVGAYNENQNGTPSNQSFYGEHPYSGSYIYLGYWGDKKSGF